MAEDNTMNNGGNRMADTNGRNGADGMHGNEGQSSGNESDLRYNPLRRSDEVIREESLSGERALYRGENLEIHDTIFHDGESPLKESRNVKLYGCEFQWKYPLWYSENVYVKDSVWQEMGRSGVWYTNHMTVEDSMIGAPKNFRRCQDVTIKNTSFANAAETFWNCDGIHLEHVTAKGDYFGMNAKHVFADHLNLYGNYAFDGGSDIEIHHSKLLTKDCFWNCDHVTVYDSYISGEYLAWNTKDITFVNCVIDSNQGLDYIDGLKLVNCRLVHTNYAFEYCENIDAEVTNRIGSVLNPGSGVIRSAGIDEKILEPENYDGSRVEYKPIG